MAEKNKTFLLQGASFEYKVPDFNFHKKDENDIFYYKTKVVRSFFGPKPYIYIPFKDHFETLYKDLKELSVY